MASNTNVCVFSGNLTRDAELRETASNTAVLSFSLAVNSRVEQNGTWTDRASFLDMTMFGNRAASIAKYMKKGQKVVVTSSARWSQWEKDGQKRTKVDFIVKDVELVGRAPTAEQSDDGGLYDVDIPF